jgi:hypothetical protein
MLGGSSMYSWGSGLVGVRHNRRALLAGALVAGKSQYPRTAGVGTSVSIDPGNSETFTHFVAIIPNSYNTGSERVQGRMAPSRTRPGALRGIEREGEYVLMRVSFDPGRPQSGTAGTLLSGSQR